MIADKAHPTNTRTSNGRFAAGNPGGPGNPYGRRVAELRRLLLEAVSDADLKAIVAKLVKQAKAGDLAAIKELLDRLIGKPAQTHLIEAVQDLERQVKTLEEQLTAPPDLTETDLQN